MFRKSQAAVEARQAEEARLAAQEAERAANPQCSFCFTSHPKAETACGPGVNICKACIDLCAQVVAAN
jgi:hypothetical protein